MKKIRIIAALLALLLFLASCSDRNAFRVGEAICTVNGKGYVSLQSAVDSITGTSSRGLDDSVYLIELIRNVDGEILDENKEGVVIPSSFTGNIIIDFKGFDYELSSEETSGFKVSGGSLTLKNGNILNLATDNTLLVIDGAEVNVEKSCFLGMVKNATILKNGASLSFKGDNEYESSIAGVFCLDKTSTLTFDGGYVYIKDIVDIDEGENGKIVIKSGKINVVHEEESRIKDIYNSLEESEKANIDIVIVHDLTKVDSKDATCTEQGNITYWKCNTCAKLFRDNYAESEINIGDTVVPALGHDVVHYEAKAATCEERGNIEHYRCNRCGIYSTHDDLSDTLSYNEVFCYDALGHDWPEDWTIEKKPTCSETGWQTKTCKRCEKVQNDYIPTVPHSVGEWKTDEGYHWKECSMCKNIVDYSGHTYSGWVQNPEKGEQTKKCEICGKEVTEEYHNLVKVEAKTVTCTEDGNKEYYKCTVHENEFFSDSSMTTKLTSSDIVINKLGHIESEEYSIDQKTHSKICTRCKTVLESEVHKWECHTDTLNKEFHTSTCTVCGRIDFVKAYGSDAKYHWEKCGANDECTWKSEKKNIHHYENGNCVICGIAESK